MMPLLGNVAEIQNFLRITKINLWRYEQRDRGDYIFIPLKIAMRKRYKNAVGGVVHAVIQITIDSDLSAEQRRLRVQHTYSPVTSPMP